MPKYYVGIYALPTIASLLEVLYQTANLTIESDAYEAKDEKGNTAAVQYINHRVRISLEGVIKKGQPLPPAGSIIKLSHLDLPTVSAAGVVTGDCKINDMSATEYEFIVDGSPSISQNNTDYPTLSLEAIRYLVNGIPDSEDSDS